MKLKYLFLGMAACLMQACASDDEPLFLEVETTSLSVDAKGGEQQVSVDCNGSYTAVPNDAWVKADVTNGKLTLTANENLGQQARSTTVALQGEGNLRQEISVTQAAYAFSETHRYKLPVVFHMLYDSEKRPNFYIEKGHMQKVMDRVNELYRNSGTDMGVEFVMATETPDGKSLEEPGVDRVKWDFPTIDCNELMRSTKKEYQDLLWDTRRYVNVLLYEFTDKNLLGISQFPWLPQPYALDGLESTPKGADVTRPKYPQCVSINNRYIYDLPTGDTYKMSNTAVTLAHELGHFLGLYHAFNQTAQGNTDTAEDTDYCTDTPPYNKKQYDSALATYMSLNGEITSLSSEGYATYVMRTNSKTGEEFRSTNVMDYAISDANRFTPQQAARVKYVLHHSIFMPGPKDYTEAEIVTTKGKGVPFEFTPQVSN